MNLKNLQSLFSDNGCQKVYIKRLAPNDNSKNQVYLGGSFEILNILPISDIKNESTGDWTRERFKATLNFSWITEEGMLTVAPHSQLILYPKYPEVRFSGFLIGCDDAPSELMTQRTANRLLFLSVTSDRRVLGYVASPDSEIAKEFDALGLTEELGIFNVIVLAGARNNKERLMNELRRIHRLHWIRSKKLDKHGNIMPCEASQCGGYTLEAELGIRPNSNAEPDFLGWELKQFTVKNFEKLNSKVITLFTPEPNGGFYAENGIIAFIRHFGYDDLRGREDRKNFGGTYKPDIRNPRTKVTMKLIGFDANEGKIRDTNGMIALLDDNDNIAASWSFSSMLIHWNRKHNQVCYVPSLVEKEPERKYYYSNKVIVGEGTDFQLFLKGVARGDIYYDPGIKLEKASTGKPEPKARSQFRTKSQFLSRVYKSSEIIDLNRER